MGKSKRQIALEKVLQAIRKNKELKSDSLDLSNLSLDLNLSIAELPDEIWELTHLRFLNLQYLGLNSLSPQIKVFKNLKMLNLDGNQFKSLPSEIGLLSKLTHLDADYNELVEIPKEFEKLKKLIHVSIQNNNLASFPICLTKLKDLYCLHLSNNEIIDFPQEAENFKNISSIDLSGNKIEFLPTSFPHIKTIRGLNLAGNKITQLPEDIGKLSTLENFNINHNKINALPTSITKLRKLNYFHFNNLPLADMPKLKEMGIVEAFQHLELMGNIGENAAFWKVPKPLVTAFKQYLNYFGEFVKTIENEDIKFEVLSTDDGLKIITKPTKNLSIDKINNLLEDFISQRNFEPGEGLSKEQQFSLKQLLHDYQFQVNQLNAQVANQAEKMQFLGDKILSKEELINALQLQIQFFTSHYPQILKLVPQSSSNKSIVQVQLSSPLTEVKMLNNNFNPDHFLKELLEIGIRLAERKNVFEIENIHNTNVCDWLRTKGFSAYDQTLSGISKKTFGELDIMIRENNGTPITIVEGLRAKSCSLGSTVISTHIDKLLHKYDTAGNEFNYLVVYSEAENFAEFWKNYIKYMDSLNSNKGFKGKYQLYSFIDTGIGRKANIKIGLATHLREEKLVKVYHIIIDMYCPPILANNSITSKSKKKPNKNISIKN